MENGAEVHGVGMAEQSQITHRRNKREEREASREEGMEDEMMSIEKVFEGKPMPHWREQITVRSMVVSFFLSIMFSVIVMKLNLTTGIIPSLNVSAGLLGFFFVRTWTKILEKSGLLRHPFTRQENTVIQTCVVAAYGIAFSGGFGSYLFAMSSRTANQTTEAKNSLNIKDPHLGWMIGFLFLVSFIGLFSLVALRKEAGEATGGKFFVGSFFWGFFQWFFTAGDDCGFVNFPTLGLEAYKSRFYFDFSATYVGVGMICPYLVNISVLIGGIISWGIMWPLVGKKRGSWYSAELPDSSLHGLQGYRIFISIAMILGDGLYNFLKVLVKTISGIVAQTRSKNTSTTLPLSELDPSTETSTLVSFDDQRRTENFLKDQIPKKSVLALAQVKPPICMKFLSRQMNDKVDTFIATLS
ncbi:hypothetical protein HPP92_022205 [Vanilla planifolia]|uniref:Metal-nicotianamine transporter YSL7 n=1 Tax=Vanilla planifolia TaxID=51239 RepID=A0A835PWZ9_VANPL|nr:hypothetical protein HPP92_022205 [Vanilla planifolia]